MQKPFTMAVVGKGSSESSWKTSQPSFTNAIASFYDSVISQAPVRFTVRDSYAAGNECANVYTITMDLGGGNRAIVEGVFTYLLDDDGKLAAMRGYWEQDKMRMEGPA